MVDRDQFRSLHQEYCDPSLLEYLGSEALPLAGAERVNDWKEILRLISVPPMPPEERNFRPTPRAGPAGPTLKDFIGRGNEGLGTYVSFRLRPEAWGIYLSRAGLEFLTGEVQRLTLRGFPEARAVGSQTLGEFAFHVALDFALGHAKFHAAVDEVAAEEEVAQGKPLYGPYLQGLQASTGGTRSPPGLALEEALANVVALRLLLNPGAMVELGDGIAKALNQDDAFRWSSYLMSGVLTAEFIFLLRILPPGYRDFMTYLGRRTEVTAYAHMGIQYSLNQEEFNKGLARLSALLFPGEEPVEPQKFLRVVQAPLYLY